MASKKRLTMHQTDPYIIIRESSTSIGSPHVERHHWSNVYSLGRVVDTDHTVRDTAKQNAQAQHQPAQQFRVLAEDQIKMADKEHLEEGDATAIDGHHISC